MSMSYIRTLWNELLARSYHFQVVWLKLGFRMELLKLRLRVLFSPHRGNKKYLAVPEAESKIYFCNPNRLDCIKYTITYIDRYDGAIIKTYRYASSECYIHDFIIACNQTGYYERCSNFKLKRIGD